MAHRNPRRGTAARAVAVLLVLLAGGCTSVTRGADTTSGAFRFLPGDGSGTFVAPGDRKPAPVLEGPSLDGGRLSTDSFRGKVLVLNVWGSWCAPCKKEQPDLERAWRDTKALGVQFVGINVRDPSKVAPLRHVERYGVTYPSFHDPASRLVARFRNVPPRTIPTTIVVDRAGRMAAWLFGAVPYRDLVALVRQVAGEAR